MPRPTQDGLRWKQTTLRLEPEWTRDPSTSAVESVVRKQLKTPRKDSCVVTFLAAGLFNKVYLVRIGRQSFVMRVTLPVYPRHKTRAEVVTLRWVRENTSVPVPRVFGFDDSNNNEIGFEWILMEYMHGSSAQKRWCTMSMEQKVALTKQVAAFQLELSGLEKPGRERPGREKPGREKQEPAFKGIGTLDSPEIDLQVKSRALQTTAAPGRLVSHEFFMGDHLGYDIPRGPFPSSHSWLSAVLKIIILHQNWVLKMSKDKDDIADAEDILPVAQKLLALLPKIFSPDSTSLESSALHHHDLNLNNILVNEQGEITAVLDWECVSALPLWMLTEVPKFLDNQHREDEPQRNLYADETRADKRNNSHGLDNEGKNDLYWIHKMEYETTQLRKVYKASLKRLCPEWAEERALQKDFYEAVSQCDGVWVSKARRWAERVEKGESVRFQDV